MKYESLLNGYQLSSGFLIPWGADIWDLRSQCLALPNQYVNWSAHWFDYLQTDTKLHISAQNERTSRVTSIQSWLCSENLPKAQQQYDFLKSFISSQAEKAPEVSELKQSDISPLLSWTTGPITLTVSHAWGRDEPTTRLSIVNKEEIERDQQRPGLINSIHYTLFDEVLSRFRGWNFQILLSRYDNRKHAHKLISGRISESPFEIFLSPVPFRAEYLSTKEAEIEVRHGGSECKVAFELPQTYQGFEHHNYCSKKTDNLFLIAVPYGGPDYLGIEMYIEFN